MNNDVEINGQNIPVHITLIKRNNGDVQFYNYNFIEQKENTPVKPARPESPEGALGTLPVGVSSEQSISQDKNNVKYSIGDSSNSEGNSGIINAFRHPIDTLAKKFGVNSDKIITAEDMEARKREKQIEAMDKFLNDPSKENLEAAQKLGVTKGMLNARKNGEEYINDVGIQDTIRRSPSKIAEKVQIFRAFYRMAERAMKKLILSRDSYGRKFNNKWQITVYHIDRS